MNITFSEGAYDYINKKIGDKIENGYVMIVDYSDGDSPYYDGGNACFCAVYNKYRILVVKEDDSNIKWVNYDKQTTTVFGKTFYRSYYESMFDKNSIFDYSSIYGGLILKGDSGIISEQVGLVVKVRAM